MSDTDKLSKIKQRDDGLWEIVGCSDMLFSSHADAATFMGIKIGRGLSENAKIFIKIFLLLVLVVAFAGWATGSFSSGPSKSASNPKMDEIKLQRLVRNYVLASLKDPGSAEFRNQYGICGEVNAKNSFGGYTGFKRFIASSEHLVIQEGSLPSSDFQEVWQEICTRSPTGATRN